LFMTRMTGLESASVALGYLDIFNLAFIS
jgi:hypothetical protein